MLSSGNICVVILWLSAVIISMVSWADSTEKLNFGCPDQCHCYQERNIPIVMANCSMSFLTSDSLQLLPQKVFLLRLENSELKELPWRFLKCNAALIALSLEYNQLELLPEDAFSNCIYLQVLILNHNHLKELPPNIFSSCTKLKGIVLNNNYLRELSSSTFKRNTDLTAL
ncbi:leucine-rich repeat-containing protein 15-like [Stylophora pistillata]|uniref:leucine-rich repeat-containing protein 15-like n=1 Tax=Stylophora pistillata TaxID=50429 RepID=UPI000C048CC1|nr:leucine-rich repeat-containing protein 15-like [Stylophora pistillata]